MVLICIIFKNQEKVLKIYFHRRFSAFECTGIFGKFQLPTACRSRDIEFLRYSAKFRKKERACTFSERKRWMYGIFRRVYFGEYETENYKFGFIQLAVTSALFLCWQRYVLFNILGTNHTSKFTFYIGPPCHTTRIIILCTIDRMYLPGK